MIGSGYASTKQQAAFSKTTRKSPAEQSSEHNEDVRTAVSDRRIGSIAIAHSAMAVFSIENSTKKVAISIEIRTGAEGLPDRSGSIDFSFKNAANAAPAMQGESERSINRRHVYTKQGRSIAGMYIQSRQHLHVPSSGMNSEWRRLQLRSRCWIMCVVCSARKGFTEGSKAAIDTSSLFASEIWLPCKTHHFQCKVHHLQCQIHHFSISKNLHFRLKNLHLCIKRTESTKACRPAPQWKRVKPAQKRPKIALKTH